MKQIRMLAQYYVDLMMKLGLVRFSMLLALALVVLAIVVQMAVTMVLHGQVESIDVIRSIFLVCSLRPGRSISCQWLWNNWRSQGSGCRAWYKSWKRCVSAISSLTYS